MNFLGNNKLCNLYLERIDLLMKPIVDKDTCIGCGLCPSICEQCFCMEEDGKAGAVVNEVPEGSIDSAKEAEQSCPVGAISIE